MVHLSRTLALAAIVGVVVADNTKIHPKLLLKLETETIDGITIAIEFKGTADEVLVSPKLESASIESRAELVEAVKSALEDHATSVQASALELLESSKLESSKPLEHSSFWINNVVYAKGVTRDVIQALAKLPEISTSEVVAANTTEWGLNIIQAPEVWAKGYRGQGVVVGSIDSGTRVTHEALKGNFRSLNGWFQPEGRSPTPVDPHGHGTHTVGTSVGANGIGVAPDAKWISCQGCLPTNKCPESVLVACAQFMLCPHDAEGKNPRCDLAPHVVNNSWGDDDEIPDVPYYKGPMAAWRKAGIIPVFANANSGPKCGTVLSPGDYDNVIGVGATTNKDGLATFSSKGPNKFGRMKPDISAPGQGIRSSYKTSDTSYSSLSGTSMATPHVTGAIALLVSAKPGITYDEVYSLLTQTVETKSLINDPLTCGGLPGDKYPNNNFGYGRMNILRAIEKIKASC
ncbi:hypothetical protein SPRG_12330 [Saprolegnia parasitica CBS 223.65]|uniref:subtilisin n=1 Tax=Saprolegnia parasitica (strain CBS 223.65) TaxID=695850 RepID=A0A067BUS4_SAPPC|nr:hypothetical protein SPRG_12330 [Saprolegnia parasitica CBS 223.65]KDO22244.1 hypothetical protein SPRG_12330 [Saprolegnia parasitica CBS 223.65]|eukprot:XP_012207080.1 hypothetical protein SPRG_12330 [Saprolegnia parasitica CBS 223.65]